MSMIRTTEDIEQLKSGWLKDPCWDLEESEGFEVHKKELRAFRLKQERKWKAERLKMVRAAEKKWAELNELPVGHSVKLSTIGHAEIDYYVVRVPTGWLFYEQANTPVFVPFSF